MDSQGENAASPGDPRIFRTRRTLAELRGHRRLCKRIVVPEGVPLMIEIPELGERLAAFSIDIFICCLTALSVLLIAELTVPTAALDVYLLAFLALRNCYFITFELRWRGATPGKRTMRLAVINRSIAALSPQAIIVRNVFRELELFVPMQAIVLVSSVRRWWEVIPFLIWLAFFAIFPLLNSDRLRVGDLAAGTLVMALPRVELLPDLARPSSRFIFSRNQLNLYGEDELHVLDHILRQQKTPEHDRLLYDICQRICAKIKWSGSVTDVDLFLNDFYTAQRAHLERRRLLGRERSSKYDSQ